MIKAIVFDLGGVVFKSDGWSYETRERLAQELKIDSKTLQDFWFERKDKMITGKMSEADYLKEFLSVSQIPLPVDKFKDLIRSQNSIDEKMVNILIQLKKKYALSALTNDVKEWIDYRIKTFNLDAYFNFILSSSDVGLAKPNIKIYEHLIEKLDLEPESVVYIDNREENLQPAANLGMKTFHFTTTEDFIKWLKIENIL